METGMGRRTAGAADGRVDQDFTGREDVLPRRKTIGRTTQHTPADHGGRGDTRSSDYSVDYLASAGGGAGSAGAGAGSAGAGAAAGASTGAGAGAEL